MFKRLMTKYLLTSMALIIISHSVLGGILFVLTERYSFAEKDSIMTKNVRQVAKLTSEVATQYDTTEYMDFYLSTVIFMATGSNSVIIVTDEQGEVNLTSDSTVIPLGTQLPESMIRYVENIEYRGMSSLGNLFESKMYIVGTDIHLDTGTYFGAVFSISNARGYSDLLKDIIRIFFGASVWVLALTVLGGYFMAKSLVNPLKTMSNAARSFAKGDFSVRVPVKGRDEMSELSMAFNNMADSLATMEQMRRNFIANVSHDLRTPMTSIAGFIDGILDGTIPEQESRQYLMRVSDEVKRLSRLVKSMLEISRMEAGENQLNPESFDLCEVASQVVVSFENAIEEKKLDVEVDFQNDVMSVYADRDAIHRVLYNLVDNAVKFCNEKGKLEVRLSDVNHFIRCEVYNTGKGIAQADIPFVFDRFYKSDKSRGLDVKGMGLGLYIVKTIVDRSGGSIGVESEENQYCRFFMVLPKKPPKK